MPLLEFLQSLPSLIALSLRLIVLITKLSKVAQDYEFEKKLLSVETGIDELSYAETTEKKQEAARHLSTLLSQL